LTESLAEGWSYSGFVGRESSPAAIAPWTGSFLTTCPAESEWAARPGGVWETVESACLLPGTSMLSMTKPLILSSLANIYWVPNPMPKLRDMKGEETLPLPPKNARILFGERYMQ
jgi:hypothetical protein